MRFFEDEELLSTELYTAMVPEEILKGEPEAEDRFNIKFENGKFALTRVRLFKNLVTFAGVDGSERFVYLSFVRSNYNVEQNNSNKYRIDLIKFAHVLSLYTDKLEIVHNWTERLSKYCVNYNFFTKYEIKEEVGKGGFGKVYRVVNNDDPSKEFAGKIFDKKAIKKKHKVLLHSEIKILQMMHHEKIVKIYEVHETGDQLVVVMELMRGGLLSHYMKEQPKLHPNVMKEIMRQLLQGLDYMASLRIIHRDIKPDNILIEKFVTVGLDKVPSIKIVDMGIACFEDQEPDFLFAGTAGFIAPEIFKCDNAKKHSPTLKDKASFECMTEAAPKLTTKVDIYSAGIIFYQMITGRSPFTSKELSTEEANELGKISFDSIYINKFPKSGVDLLKKMLDSKPKNRPSAAEALAHDYFGVADSNTLHSNSPSNMSKSSRKIHLDFKEDDPMIALMSAGKQLKKLRSRSFH